VSAMSLTRERRSNIYRKC